MGMAPLLYVKYFSVFILVSISFGFTFLAIRKFADFLIALSIIGFTTATCASIYNGSISSWPQIAGVSIGAGILACLVCIPILPFSSSSLNLFKLKSPIEPEKTEANSALQTQPKL
jgi:hypothetical protein